MSNLSKYLKYKNKYMKLKNTQRGGMKIGNADGTGLLENNEIMCMINTGKFTVIKNEHLYNEINDLKMDDTLPQGTTYAIKNFDMHDPSAAAAAAGPRVESAIARPSHRVVSAAAAAARPRHPIRDLEQFTTLGLSVNQNFSSIHLNYFVRNGVENREQIMITFIVTGNSNTEYTYLYTLKPETPAYEVLNEAIRTGRQVQFKFTKSRGQAGDKLTIDFNSVSLI
jgi:hypothetical protein